MIECRQIAKWKLIGLQLGLDPGILAIIESDCHCKAENCCMEMLIRWCDDDSNASLEKLKERISKVKSIDATDDIYVVKSFLVSRYDKARYNKLIQLGLPYKPENFTNVAYIQHNHSEVTEESVTAVANILYTGDIIIDYVHASNILIQSSDYYTSCTKGKNLLEFLHCIDSVSNREPFLFLIEGSPGIGKTAICKEIAFQWSMNKKADFIFSICLHEATSQNISSFDTLFEYICPGKLAPQVNNVSDYLANGIDKRIIVIIDGYEELFNDHHSSSKTFIDQIVKRDVLQFQKCDLIISTRSAAIVDLSGHMNWHRVELLGFTEEQQQQYIKCNIESEGEIVKLNNYLNAKPLVRSFCFHPLFINFMISLYNHLNHLSKFQTKLTDKFACVMILWVLKQQLKLNIFDITVSILLKNLPEHYNIAISKICNLAFNTLLEETVIFGPKHSDAFALQNYPTDFGFYKVLESKNKFCFHLPIIQELMAAFFIAQPNNILRSWDKTKWHYNCINVWAYHFGLEKAVPEEFKKLLFTPTWFIKPNMLSNEILQNKIKCLYLVYCLSELTNEGIYQQAKQVVLMNDYILDISNCKDLTNESLNIVTLFLSFYSVRQWMHLSLSNCSLDDVKLDYLLQLFVQRVKYMPKVDTLDLSSNHLTEKSINVIFRITHILNASKVILSQNKEINDEEICMNLVSHTETSLSYHIINDKKIHVLFCHKHLHDLQPLTTLTDLYIIKCSLDGGVLDSLVTVKPLDRLSSLYLMHMKWNGKPLYILTEFFEKNIFIFIGEHGISGDILNDLVCKFDTDVNVSRIISTNDIFIANKCNYNMLKLHLTAKLPQLLLSIKLFYVRNCLLADEPQNSNIVSNYLDKQNMIAEIILCNNGLRLNNVYRMIKTLKQLKMLKSIFICELQQKIYVIKIARLLLLHIFNCSFLVMENKAVIGNKASLEQLNRCLSLISRSTNVLRFISCSFDNEHYGILLNVLKRDTALEEFSLYECRANNFWIKQLLGALQGKSSLTSLLLSFKIATHVEADSIATALSTVIHKNPSLEKVSLKFDGLPSSVCVRIFQALSKIRCLKHLRFCDGQITTKEALDQLYKTIANNSSLEVVNVRNNKLQSSGIKAISKAFRNIYHLRLLALNGNDIDEEAAEDIASIIANNVTTEKLLLYNNALKSKGICTICQALRGHKYLKVFRIGKNSIQEEAADYIAEVINHNPLLRVVDVASNKLLTKGIMKITKQLEKNTNLQKLSLNENNITCTDSAAASLARIIMNNSKLKALHLDNNNFSISGNSKIVEAINKLTVLKELTINNTGFTANHIAAMITNNLQIEILDIGNNKLKSEGINKICKGLANLSCLKILGLYGNEITDDAADAIAEVISSLSALEKLQLGNNAFRLIGIQTICESLKQGRALKLLELDNIGITEEAADCLVSVIDHNPLLKYLYLGNNRLSNTGANVILDLLKSKKDFKALTLNNNFISEDIIDNIIQFVTNNSELEELALNKNSIGTTGILKVSDCLKNVNTLRILKLADNNVNDKVNYSISSVIESNTALEVVSIDSKGIVSNNKLLTAIAKLDNLKYMQINCKVMTVNDERALVNSIFDKSNVQEISIMDKDFGEEMHFLSPSRAIETVLVIKAISNKPALHMPVLHSVVMEKKVEILCMNSNVLVKSQVRKLIDKHVIKRLVLVFTKLNDCTNLEMNFITANVHQGNIKSLIIAKLSANKYSSDISGIVIIEKDEITALLTGDSLREIITKLLNNFKRITNLVLCSENISNFTYQDINKIANIISKTTRMKRFTFRTDALPMKAMKNANDCLNKTISIKTANVLTHLNVRNFDLIHFKSDKPVSELVELMEAHQQFKIDVICAVRNNLDLISLDLSGNVINVEEAKYLATLLSKLTKLEFLSLKNCYLGNALKSICLQKVTTLKYLDLSNNNLTEVEPIVATLKSNRKLEKLFINKNFFKLAGRSKLNIAIANMKNLNVLSIDQSIVTKEITLKPAAIFSTFKVFIYNHYDESTEVLDITDPVHCITTLTLCKCSVGIKNVSLLSANIKKTGVVLSLCQQNNYLEITKVIKSLSDSKIITKIELHNISIDKLTTEEEDTIATIIKDNTQLEHVLLGSHSHNSVTDEFPTFHNGEIMFNKPSKCDKIYKSITFSCKFLLEIVSTLKNYVNLKTLDLSCCHSNIELVAQLSTLLGNCTKLEKLSLQGFSLGDNDFKMIANSLKSVTILKYLDLSGNNITVYHQIIKILEANNKLEILYLEKNCFPATADDKFSVAITNLKYLKQLSIDQNIVSSNMITVFFITMYRTLYIYNDYHEVTEVIDNSGPLSSVDKLTMCKLPNDKFSFTSVVSNILETGTILLLWTHSDILSTAAVLKFLDSSKQITTITLLNISGSILTEVEVDTIANFIGKNVQLNKVSLGINCVKAVMDDFNAQMMSVKDNQTSDNVIINFFPHMFPKNLMLKILNALQNITDLRTLDLSGNVITEELAEQLAIVLANSTKLEKLLLNECCLSNEGINVIANSLKTVSTLECLNLSNNNISEELAMVNIFKSNTKLKKLQIHKNCLHLFAGDNLGVAIINLSDLKVLGIDENIITRNMALQLANSFTSAINLFIYNHDHQTTEVIQLRGSFNNIKALTLCKTPTLVKSQHMLTYVLENGSAMLWWTQNDTLNTRGILIYLCSLKKITTIKFFNSSDCKLTEIEVDTIATAISESAQLENVWLGSQSIQTIIDDFDVLEHKIPDNKMPVQLESTENDQAVADQLILMPKNEMFPCRLLLKILFALQSITDLKALDLSGNVITEELAEQLAIVLAKSTNLEMLFLRDCYLGNKGINIILNNITTLKHLDLSGNNITEEPVMVSILKNNDLEEFFFHKNCLRLPSRDNLSVGIVNSKNLKSLSIDQNIISRKLALKLANAFTTSARLFIYNHDYQIAEMIAIRGPLHNITTLTFIKYPYVRETVCLNPITLILDSGSAVIRWTQNDILITSGVLRFLTTFEKITTIKLHNNSNNRLTELEVDTLATIISDNMQLENVWLGSQSVETIIDDFNALKDKIPEVKMQNQFMKSFINTNKSKKSMYSLYNNFFPCKMLSKFLHALKNLYDLKTLDLSGNVITEELAEQLAIVLAHFTKLETLLLGDCSLHNEGINIIANSLKGITTLKCLDLRNNNITEELAMVNILSSNTKLKELLIHENCLQLSVRENMKNGIMNLKNLEVLSIDQSVISRIMALQLANTFNFAVKLFIYNHDHQTPEYVKIKGPFNNITALALSKSPSVEEVSLSTMILETGSAVIKWTQNDILTTAAIFRFLSFKKITTIKLVSNSDVELTELEVDTIATIISKNVQLENVCVWLDSQSVKKTIKDEFAVLSSQASKIEMQHSMQLNAYSENNQSANLLKKSHILSEKEILFLKILRALKSLYCLKTLNLSGNVITEELAEQLAIVLANSTKLETLLLGDCSLCNKGIKVISNSLKNTSTLKQLDLSNNNITEELTMVNFFRKNDKLEEVRFDKNDFHLFAGDNLSGSIVNLKNLKLLSIDHNIISKRMALQLAKIFTTAAILLIYNHDHQTSEVIEIRGLLHNITALTLCKIPNVNEESIRAFILNNGSVMIWWTQHNLLNTSDVLRFLCNLKKITTIKILIDSDNELTELEVDTIAQTIRENTQLENVWFGSQSIEIIKEDFVVLTNQTSENNIQDYFVQLIPSTENDRSTNPLKMFVCKNEMFTCKLLSKILCSLQKTSNLKTLDLSGNVITKELAEKLTIVLANSTKLEALLLKNCSIGNKVVDMIAESLNSIYALKYLNFSGNHITKEVNFVKLKHLKALSIDQSIISRDMAIKFANSHFATNGIELYIYDNEYQTNELIKFENSLKNIHSLKLFKYFDKRGIDRYITLILKHASTLLWNQSNILSPASIIKFLSAFKKITTITMINNSGIQYTEQEANTIATVISGNLQLQYFEVNTLSVNIKDSNKLISSPRYNQKTYQAIPLLKLLQSLKSHTKLKTLGLSGYVITDELAKQLAVVLANSTNLETLLLRYCFLCNKGVNTIFNSLKTSHNLYHLNLFNNNITTKEANGIAAVINNNPLLQIVILGNNKLETKGIITIAKALRNIIYLTVLDLSNNSTTERAAIFVADIIHSSTTLCLESLMLNDNDYQSNGIKIICRSLMKIKTLKVLILNNNSITNEAASDIAKVINNNPSLETLRVGNNNLQSKGVLALCHSLKNLSHLKQLDIESNLITEEAADDIVKVINTNCKLEILCLRNNKLKFMNQSTKPNKLALFSRNDKLQEIVMSLCLLKSSVITKIMQTLKSYTGIKALILDYNYITNRHEVTDNISQVILNNNQLEKFHISYNQLQAKGITAILQSLKKLNSLKEMAIRSNNILTEDISDDIVDVITNNNGLEILGIGYSVNSKGAIKVSGAIKSLSHLVLLDVSGNNINEEAADEIATAITNNDNLAKLYIADNHLGTIGVAKIAKAFINSRGWLKFLDITNNHITDEAAESIAKMILANPSLETLLLGEGCLQIRNASQPKEKISRSRISHDAPKIKLNDVLIAKQMQKIKEMVKLCGPVFPLNFCIVDTSNDCYKIFESLQASNLLKSKYNKLQSDGVKRICKAFANVTSLKVLTIENNNTDDEAVDDITAALVSNSAIQQLWIGENNFTPSGISAILRPLILKPIIEGKSTLEALDLSYSNLSVKETADNIFVVLSLHNKIKQLWLEGNNLISQYIKTILDAIKKCTNISVFSLRDDNITEKEANVLSEALSKKSELQQLFLGNNHLQDRGVIKVTRALCTTHNLLTLDLMNNFISKAAADALVTVITSCSLLEQLYLGDNKLESAGTIKIASAIRKSECRSTLRVLDLSNNMIGSDETVGDEISRAVANSELLTVLILDDNALSIDGLMKITRSLKQSESADYMMIFSVMRNDVMINEKTKDEMRAVMADQPDCKMFM